MMGPAWAGRWTVCQARFAEAAPSRSARNSTSATPARTRLRSSGTSRVVGTARAIRRSGGRSIGGIAPTRKRSSRTTTARSFKRARISSERRDSSFAHTLLGTRNKRTPSSSASGFARSAIRAPTASRHTDAGRGCRVCANRFSPARFRIARRGSGIVSLERERLAIRMPFTLQARSIACFGDPAPSSVSRRTIHGAGLRSETLPSGACPSNTAPLRSVVPARTMPSAKSSA